MDLIVSHLHEYFYTFLTAVKTHDIIYPNSEEGENVLLIFILSLFCFFVLGLCIYCFKTCFYAANKTPQDPYGQLHGEQFLAVRDHIYASTRHMEAVPFEEVTIQSFDGLSLSGRYYHLRDGAPVKIIFHGYRSFALRDSAGGFTMARKLGMNVLAVDQRAHGKSGGHVITFGILERRDCLSWIQYINQRCGADTPIILSGLSMGAATVVMATSLPLPENVVCVPLASAVSCPPRILPVVWFMTESLSPTAHLILTVYCDEARVCDSSSPVGLSMTGNSGSLAFNVTSKSPLATICCVGFSHESSKMMIDTNSVHRFIRLCYRNGRIHFTHRRLVLGLECYAGTLIVAAERDAYVV